MPHDAWQSGGRNIPEAQQTYQALASKLFEVWSTFPEVTILFGFQVIRVTLCLVVWTFQLLINLL